MRSCSHVAAARLLAASALAAVSACGDGAILVVVDGDLAVPGDLDGVCLYVGDRDPGGGEFGAFYRLGPGAGDDDTPRELPQSLAVEPGAASAAFVTARGYKNGVEVARAHATTEFGGNLTLRLDRCHDGSDADARVVDTDPAPTARAVASIGREGTAILAVAALASGDTRVLAADGSELVELGAGPVLGAVSALVAFDADGDCDDDIAVLRSDAGPSLLRRDPGPVFTEDAAALADAGLGALRAATPLDADSDGDIDLVAGGGATLALLRNDGAGRFTRDAAAIPAGAVTDVTALAAGDLDGDGHGDLVVGQGDDGGAPPRVLFNDTNGDGFFVLSAAALPEVPLRARAVTVVDTDADGFRDVLVASVGTHVRLYIGRGDGRLEDQSFVRLPDVDAVDAAAVTAADWSGDCAVDVAIATDSGAAPILWRGSDTGNFDGETAGDGATATGAAFADLDDDGRLDLLLFGPATGVTWMERP